MYKKACLMMTYAHAENCESAVYASLRRGAQELEGMLDDDQDMADMYLGRRQDAETSKASHEARQAIEPPSPSHSAQSLDSIEAADYMDQTDTDTEPPARHNQSADPSFIMKRTPVQQAQPPPPQVPPSLALRLVCSCCLSVSASQHCCSQCYSD